MWKRNIRLYDISLCLDGESVYIHALKRKLQTLVVLHIEFEYSSYLHDFKLLMFLCWWNRTTTLFTCPENLQFIASLLMSKLYMPDPENSFIRCHSKHFKLFLLFVIVCYIHKAFFTYTQEIHLALVLVLARTGLIFDFCQEGAWSLSLSGAGGRKSFPR